jgi:SDR family mycofactocin-dependent oxidoreductase
MGLLDGRVAFVTGAARGQGRSHAIRLAQEGADIIAFDVCTSVAPVSYESATSEDLDVTRIQVEQLGKRILTCIGDVRDTDALDTTVTKGMAEFGQIDIVLANAGVLVWDRFWEISDEAWQATIDINLTGVWRTLKATAPVMIDARRGGSIIATSSVAGIKSLPGQAHYSAAKHGVVGLVKTAAIELGQFGIRVNSIHPWGVNTEMMNDPSIMRIMGLDPTFGPSFGSILSNPIAEPDDISNAVVWLASDLSRHVTGAQIPIDMGATKI